MAVKRKTYTFRKGDVIDVEEYHDGKYGAPGVPREKKTKLTPEQVSGINHLNKVRRCRHKLLQYFTPGDAFATWTYDPKCRPPNMKDALRDFQKAMRKVRAEYKKRGMPLRWIRNIEQGTRGAWHIHLVVNECGNTAGIIIDAWDKGGTYVTKIRKNSLIFDEDFTKLANYMTKDERHIEKKKDGEPQKTKIKESSYSTSRNMPLKKAKVDKLNRWKAEPKPKKGYYIAKIHEGINCLGFRYRRYTMIRLQRRE